MRTSQSLDPFLSIARTYIDAQLAVNKAFALSGCETTERIMKLGLAATKETFNKTADSALRMLTMDKPELASAGQLRCDEMEQKMVTYSEMSNEIAFNLYQAAQIHLIESNKVFSAFYSELANSMPTPSNADAMELVKAAMDNVRNFAERYRDNLTRAPSIFETSQKVSATAK